MKRSTSTNGQAAFPAFHLHHDARGRLVLSEPDGQQRVGVEVIRAFPLSDPEHGIAICDADGHEIAWIDDIGNVPLSMRRLLEAELARREFVPVIQRVLRISAPMEPSEWEVETDRGRTRFLLNSENDVRPLDAQRALIVDAHGIRYLIADVAALDPVSQRLLERFL